MLFDWLLRPACCFDFSSFQEEESVPEEKSVKVEADSTP